ncbi:ABC transporter permease [Nocardia neocaledoniensis NBRC 108232]|uniref:Putative blue pigment (Indigoidine) exporter n=1 Tax=Nocardia neocaledoniensis TaxID=236511 RepID=A0A317NB62_9NOCA|nr:EamA family transporter [Nocardia neocaledoniensis]PWV72214.1 putative blue pigment (indigoidine) exporter [Nocardia neocaledoniensis]GEM32485.1 ABC transporter permease [Nocardia neocaledoniensis NBRC 108232]
MSTIAMKPVAPVVRAGRVRDALLTAVAPASFGTVYAATTLLPPDRPLLAATVRSLPAGLLIVAFARTLPRGAWWWKTTVLAVLNFGAFFPLVFVAAYRLPGGIAAALGSVQPLLVAALSVPLLGVRTPRAVVLAGVAVALGVTVMAGAGPVLPDPLGIAAMLAATALIGTAIVLGKKWGSPVPALTMAGWQLALGGLMLLPLTLVVEGRPPTITATNLLGYAYIGLVATVLAYALWFRGVQRLPATSVSLLTAVNPLVATVAGLLLFHQTLGPWQSTGFAIALVALVVGQSMNRSTT